ncbi:TylF/MycF/NovP-related O-methyltransferase [Sulfurimonas sp.]|uniref:TylF/MycF/NovP-related O-methyltransferase n=1 Tax=Sulfurimonas sp. TaxID=2022749 RepID=UPI002AB04A05|nr:TylF/MycF/NovP-related O-methyltransferase [Sulfurimonas sp.]
MIENVKKVLGKYLMPELIYFIQKRIFRKDYSFVMINNVGTYHEDSLIVTDKNLDFLKEKSFLDAYNNAVEKNLYVSPTIRWRLHMLCWAASISSNLEGDFVECGVNKGFSSKIIIDYLNFDTLNKKYYLMDTFEGLVEDLLSDAEKNKKGEIYEPCIDIVKKNFREYRNVEIIQGMIPETLDQVKSDKISFLHIDMNCVFPESEALKYFWDKLVKGGIVIFDDYGWAVYHAQKKAHDLFAESKGVKIATLPTGQGLLIKPF